MTKLFLYQNSRKNEVSFMQEYFSYKQLKCSPGSDHESFIISRVSTANLQTFINSLLVCFM